MKYFYLKVYNFLVWVDRKNQRPRQVICPINGLKLECRKTPVWLGRLSMYFLDKSE